MTGPQKSELKRLVVRFNTIGLNSAELQRKTHLEQTATSEVSNLAKNLAKGLSRHCTRPNPSQESSSVQTGR